MIPARGAFYLLRAGIMLAATAWALQAVAQDKPRPRPKPLPEPSDRAAAAANSLSDLTGPDAPGAATRPLRPPVTGTPVVRPLLAAPPPLVLRSAVHSRYSRQATIARSTTGQCRAQCAITRTQCATAQGDTSGCDAAWTQCLSTCEGLSYSRGP